MINSTTIEYKDVKSIQFKKVHTGGGHDGILRFYLTFMNDQDKVLCQLPFNLFRNKEKRKNLFILS
ncbi:hypothetical protein [Metabacillus herbersteinensis]|uniref:hypothetical protein n=1 Tax=Metabacillus herbersteinensis TaxID=283816 RepID=UPI0036733211